MSVRSMALQARQAQRQLQALSEAVRVQALNQLASAIRREQSRILAANQKDLQEADRQGLEAAMRDRLKLDSERIEHMASAVESVANQPPVVGEILSRWQREDGLQVEKQRIPIGVLALIFESRPNVLIESAALSIKSGNALILKGGKEAAASNACLAEIIQESCRMHLPPHCIVVLDSQDRSLVHELLSLQGVIDVVIPRGGESLIRFVYDHAKMPVIAHFKGLCHIYVDQSAKLSSARDIVLNAKTQRPGVCNAVETLLLHSALPEGFVAELFQELTEQGVELRVDAALHTFYPDLLMANEHDWQEEYLDRILSVRTVASVDEAIAHIQMYGSQHTEAVIAEDQDVIDRFTHQVDASLVAVNASTRFNDGGQLGLGAELGIATTKLHAYGPMGAAEMTTSRFLLTGNGHIRP